MKGESADRPWTEDFDFYMSRLDQDAVAVFVDLGAGPHVPLPSHPLRLNLVVRMQSPRPDGLRSQEESPRLFELEDRLVAQLLEALSAVFVGRVMTRGITDLVFYAPGAVQQQLEAVTQVVEAARGDYEIEVRVEPDEKWTFFGEVLLPGPFEHQFIMSNRVLRELAEAGDDPSLPRPVDHIVLLGDRESALSAAAALRERGFSIPHPAGRDDGRWEISFADEIPLHEGRIHERVNAILEEILPLKGTYDGWGCKVTRG